VSKCSTTEDINFKKTLLQSPRPFVDWLDWPRHTWNYNHVNNIALVFKGCLEQFLRVARSIENLGPRNPFLALLVLDAEMTRVESS
jgi:hypothetical protein